MTRVEPSLHEYRVTRHSETENPENETRKDQTRGRCLWRSPVCIGKVLPDNTQKIEHADDIDEAGILEEPDERVHNARNDQFQRLRQNYQTRLLPIAEAQRIRALILPSRNGLKTAAHHFRHIG